MTQSKSQVRVLGDSGQARMTSRDLLSIHEFAQVCRTTPRTLRFYEKKGLFKPARVDSFTKYRFYDPKQARDFLKIKLLQNFHVPLAQIRGSLSKKSAEEFLHKKLEGLKEEIREKEKEYKFLKGVRSFLFQQDINDCHAELNSASNKIPKQVRNDKDKNIFQAQTFGPFTLFCMKVEHGEYARITEYIKALWKEAKRRKLNCENSEITFYLNNAYNPKNTPLEIALILRKSTSEESRSLPRHLGGVAKVRLAGLRINNSTIKQFNNNFYFKTYPKTKILAYDYNGPYEYLILVYQKLFSYIENQKIKLKGLVFETYKYGPLNTKSKYDYQTIIGFPV